MKLGRRPFGDSGWASMALSISLGVSSCPEATELCPEEGRQPSSALLRGTFDPAVLLKLGGVKLEATVLGLCLLDLSVLRSHPYLRLRLGLRLRLRLRLGPRWFKSSLRVVRVKVGVRIGSGLGLESGLGLGLGLRLGLGLGLGFSIRVRVGASVRVRVRIGTALSLA